MRRRWELGARVNNKYENNDDIKSLLLLLLPAVVTRQIRSYMSDKNECVYTYEEKTTRRTNE